MGISGTLQHLAWEVCTRMQCGKKTSWQRQCAIGQCSCGCFFGTYSTTYLNNVADQAHHGSEAVFSDCSGLFQQDNAPCSTAKWLRNGLRNTTRRRLKRAQSPHIAIQSKHLWGILLSDTTTHLLSPSGDHAQSWKRGTYTTFGRWLKCFC